MVRPLGHKIRTAVKQSDGKTPFLVRNEYEAMKVLEANMLSWGEMAKRSGWALKEVK
jgi:hypothetical protein